MEDREEAFWTLRNFHDVRAGGLADYSPAIMAAFGGIWTLRNFHDVNGALSVLLPKAKEATTLKDYRPFSLIHIVGKLFSKVLASRLTPRLSELMHPNQSAFVKGRLIHDSFKFVQSSAPLLHSRQPSLMIKIDITRAFDSVGWLFLLQILQHMGFPGR
jgi:hypothetical protein